MDVWIDETGATPGRRGKAPARKGDVRSPLVRILPVRWKVWETRSGSVWWCLSCVMIKGNVMHGDVGTAP